MNKHARQANPSTNLTKLDFALGESSYIDFLARYGRTLLFGIFALLALILLFVRWGSYQRTNSEMDYLNADSDFKLIEERALFSNEPLVQDEAYQDLQMILARHPELHEKFDGMLAQLLIINGANTEASEFARNAIQRTQTEPLASYTDYARTTVLILEKDYQKALESALILNTKLQDAGHEDILYPLNMLRIAFLHQELGNQNEELQTWDNFLQRFDSPSYQILLDKFTIGKLTLKDYIARRQVR